MENALIILRQAGIMFFYMAVGLVLFRTKLVTKEGSRSIGNVLLYVVIPAVVLNSFCVEHTPERAADLVVSFGMAAAMLMLSMAVSHILFRKSPVDDFGAAFSNAGFIGFPMVTALLGQEAVFYATGFVALLNALQWTYGQHLLSGDRRDLRPGVVLKNPVVLALAAGLIIFFCRVPVPGTVKSMLSSVAGMNAPLAMLVLGVYLAQLDVKRAVSNWRVYAATAARLVGIPLLSLLLLTLLPKDRELMRGALFIVSMAPVGSNVAVYAQKQNADYPYAVGLVCVSTVLAVLTMPLLMLLL